MKEFLSALLAVLLLISVLVACDSHKDVDDAGSGRVSSENKEKDTTTEAPAEEYKNITCRNIMNYQGLYFGENGKNDVLRVSLPKEWSIESVNGSAYRITREQTEIGEVEYRKYEQAEEKDCLLHKNEKSATIAVDSCVVHNDSRLSGYERRFVITDKSAAGSRALVISVDYAEMDEFSSIKLMATAETSVVNTDAGLGKLALTGAAENKGILVLGNSFVNSSEIGRILKGMCANGGKTNTVRAISRGYATVSKTYSQDESILAEIKAGQWGIVFMCGFYSSADAPALQVILDACKASGTKLVIFPAHNEKSDVIKSAVSKYGNDVGYLDWKGEIDRFLSTGMAGTKMYYEDAHLHSTPLAGFVGAHMIYRQVFGELPPEISTSVVTTAEARTELGDHYLKTASFAVLKEEQIYRFS